MMLRGTAYKRIRNTLMLVVAAAALFPLAKYSLWHARESAKQEVCARNLKVIGEACRMYQEDWHDVLVPYGAPYHGSYLDCIWYVLLDPYIRRKVDSITERDRYPRIFRCPTAVEQELSCATHDYGMNYRCGGWFLNEKPVVVPVKSVRYPHSTIRIAEVSWLAGHGVDVAAKPSDFKPGDPMCHLFPAWHMGRGNVLWIDGHVSSMTQKQYNMRDKGPYNGNIWLRLEGPKPPLP